MSRGGAELVKVAQSRRGAPRLNGLADCGSRPAHLHLVAGLMLPSAVGAKAAAPCHQKEVGEPIYILITHEAPLSAALCYGWLETAVVEAAVARNPVQFQKGLSLGAFLAAYGAEAQCHAALVALRWPKGFVCPRCGGRRHGVVGPRRLFQCSACRYQVSVKAGTVFAASKLALTKWFLAIYLMTQSKNDIAALELMRQLGVRYDTAWLVKQKLMAAMLERNRQRPLGGEVQIDDAYLGGELRSAEGGRRGRGSPNKLPFVAAVATRDGRPVAVHLRRVAGFTKQQIGHYAKTSLAPGTAVVSDGLHCFAAIAEAGFPHTVLKVGGGTRRPAEPAFAWVNTVLGNVKSAITGTCRALGARHSDRYLAAYEYRFNRRADLKSMVPRLAYVALRQPPTPYRILVPAELSG